MQSIDEVIFEGVAEAIFVLSIALQDSKVDEGTIKGRLLSHLEVLEQYPSDLLALQNPIQQYFYERIVMLHKGLIEKMTECDTRRSYLIKSALVSFKELAKPVSAAAHSKSELFVILFCVDKIDEYLERDINSDVFLRQNTIKFALDTAGEFFLLTPDLRRTVCRVRSDIDANQGRLSKDRLNTFRIRFVELLDNEVCRQRRAKERAAGEYHQLPLITKKAS